MDNENLVPLSDFKWTEDYSYHRKLTCKNHPNLRWSTKNYWDRSLFFMGDVADTKDETYSAMPTVPECTCPVHNYRVVVDESQPPDRKDS